jgi:hypothetical protein
MAEVILGLACLGILTYVLAAKRNEPAHRLVRLLQAAARLVKAWRKRK